MTVGWHYIACPRSSKLKISKLPWIAVNKHCLQAMKVYAERAGSQRFRAQTD
jgi:hypothetical protein